MTTTQRCPSCAENVIAGAIKCRHCHEELNSTKVAEVRQLILAGQSGSTMVCPLCAEKIMPGGTLCPFCREPLSSPSFQPSGATPPAQVPLPAPSAMAAVSAATPKRSRLLKLVAGAVAAVAVLGVAAYFLILRQPASSIEFFGVRYGQSCADFTDAVFDSHQRYFDINSKVRGSGSSEVRYNTKSEMAEACEAWKGKGGWVKFAAPNGTLMELRVFSDDDDNISGWGFYITVQSPLSTSGYFLKSHAVVAGERIEGAEEVVTTKVRAEANELRRSIVAPLGDPLVQLPCGSATTKVWRLRKHLLIAHDCGGGVLELFSARSYVEDHLHSDEMRSTVRKALRDDGLDL